MPLHRCFSIFLVCIVASSQRGAADEPESVLGILNRRCVECHGPSKQSGKLRLDTLDAIFKGGRSGPTISAGKSGESLLYQRVSSEEPKKRMPPKGEALEVKEVDAIRTWIDRGATAPVAAATASARTQSVESVQPHADKLPGDFTPVFCLAGEASGQHLALGQGTAVLVYEIQSAPQPKEGKNSELVTARVAVLRGHDDVVQSVAFSPDGKLLASGDFGVARLWSTETWQPLRVLKPHTDRVLAMAFSPDSKRLASAAGLPTESGEIRAWDVERGVELWSATPHTDVVYGLAWSQDGKQIATGGADRVTYLLDASTGKQMKRLEAHTHHVLAVAISPDGKRGVTGGADRKCKLWDLEKGENLRTVKGHEKSVSWVGFYADGKYFASTGGDGKARFWDFENENERFTLNEAKGYLQAGCFFAGEKRFATAEQEGPIRIYDVEKRQLLLTIEPTAR